MSGVGDPVESGEETRSGPVLVLGDGRSGRAAMALLAKLGWDAAQVADGLRDLAAFGDLTELAARGFSEAVVSPGFAIDHPWLERLRSAGVPLVSELEFGARHVRSKALAVTGSLGKTTIVTAAVEIFRTAGFSAEAVGNIGRPVSDLALAEEHPDWMVVEVSSFQLETMSRFAPQGAAVLNVFANHLDRHGDFSTYLDLKLSLLTLVGDGPAFVGPIPDQQDASPPELERLAPHEGPIYIYEEGGLVSNQAESVGPIDLRGAIFDNSVLGTNAAVLASVLVSLGVSQASISKGLKSISALDHRVQELAPFAGVRYINDSKSTCVAATIGALRQLRAAPGSVLRLLLGGRPKQDDFFELIPHLRAHQVVVYAFGEAAPIIVEALSDASDKLRVIPVVKFADAVRLAFADALPGEVVLLSPGCTSFDEFSSYAERGQRFQSLLNQFQTE